MKYTRQPAPEHSSSDEGIKPYLSPKADNKSMKESRRDDPSTFHSSSAIKGSNDKSKYGTHFSLDLKLKCKVNTSNVHGIPLAPDNALVVRHRVYTPTLDSATFQHSIANDSATLQHVLQCYRNLSARSRNVREPIPDLSAFFPGPF